MNQAHISLWRRPVTWVISTIAAILGIFFAYYYFTAVFPIISLDLRMNRTQALEQAHRLAQLHQWGPLDGYQTALFSGDSETKNFIELEGGGKDRLLQLIADNKYTPYTWEVRFFKEREINETTISFKPDGTVYGFQIKVPDAQEGAALDEVTALAIVQEGIGTWNLDVKNFSLIEHQQEEKAHHRIDHTFVYENSSEPIGQGNLRIKFHVTGNQLTEIKQYIQVPENFKRRYQEMRSSNNTIAATAFYFVYIFYFLIGGVIGLFFLLRKNYIIWNYAIAWGLFIAFLDLLSNINSIPLIWHEFDTALSASSFWMQIIIFFCMSFFKTAGMAIILIMAAEGLTRVAFGNQLQLWKLWSPEVVNTPDVIGRTYGAYLLLGFKFSFVTAFYYITQRYFGWWSPTDALIDPNLLATYLPWLSSLANSLHAGFIEECWFRAIPLSCAAIIGARYNKRTTFIVIALIAQAVIFGAAHANYPAQPAYARIIELIIPSLVFGTVYLYFGLLTSIITHYVYDVVWFALPLFISHTPGIWIERMMVILGAGIPLLVVLAACYKYKIVQLNSNFYNKNWKPTLAAFATKKIFQGKKQYQEHSKKIALFFIGIGLLSLIGWGATTRFVADTQPLQLSYQQALEQGALFAQKHNLDQSEWTILAGTSWPATEQKEPSTEQPDEKLKIASALHQHLFVWQTMGSNQYHNLLSSYLFGPQWIIRIAKFTGDVVARAEEYKLYYDNENLFRIKHTLPETTPGNTLEEKDAMKIALTADLANYSDNTKLVIAYPEKKPARTDWTFVFQDAVQTMPQASSARIKVVLNGDVVSDTNHYVQIPQPWERQEQDRFIWITEFITMASFLITALTAFGIGQALLSWVSHHFNTKIFYSIILVLIAKTAIQVWNLWPRFIFDFKTTEPYQHQIMMLFWMLIVSSIYRILPVALLGGLLHYTDEQRSVKKIRILDVLIGLSIGISFVSISSICGYFSPQHAPLWPDFINSGARLPWLSIILSTLTTYLTATMNGLLFQFVLTHLEGPTALRRFLTMLLCIVAGIAIIGAQEPILLLPSIISGILIGIWLWICSVTILIKKKELIPLVVSGFFSIKLIQQASFAAFPGALFGSVAAILLLILMGIAWYRYQKTIHYL